MFVAATAAVAASGSGKSVADVGVAAGHQTSSPFSPMNTGVQVISHYFRFPFHHTP